MSTVYRCCSTCFRHDKWNNLVFHRVVISISFRHQFFEMGTRQRSHVQFILFPDAAIATSSNTRSSLQKARSHGARTAHARKRLARTAEYNAQRSGKEIPSNSQGQHRSTGEPATKWQLHPSPKPLSVMSASRCDPFDSFATNLSHNGRFLLDHCRPTFIEIPEACHLLFPDAQVVVPTLHVACKDLRDICEREPL